MIRWNHTVGFLATMAILQFPGPARADHDLDVYAFDDLFVYDTFAYQRPIWRHFNVVVLRDSMDLKIAARHETTVDVNVVAYAHHRRNLIVLIGPWIEVFDLARPEHKQPVRRWQVGRMENKASGNSGIRADEDGFTIAANVPDYGRVGTKLVTMGQAEDWELEYLDQDAELTVSELTTANFTGFGKSEILLILETEQYRYQVEWEVGSCSPRRNHRKFLRKRRIRDGDLVSSLLLGGNRKHCGGE